MKKLKAALLGCAKGYIALTRDPVLVFGLIGSSVITVFILTWIELRHFHK